MRKVGGDQSHCGHRPLFLRPHLSRPELSRQQHVAALGWHNTAIIRLTLINPAISFVGYWVIMVPDQEWMYRIRGKLDKWTKTKTEKEKFNVSQSINVNVKRGVVIGCVFATSPMLGNQKYSTIHCAAHSKDSTIPMNAEFPRSSEQRSTCVSQCLQLQHRNIGK